MMLLRIKRVVKSELGPRTKVYRSSLVYQSHLEGANKVGAYSRLIKCDVGMATYFGRYCSFEKAKIGKYCSIANDVKVIVGKHPASKWVSTHPSFFSMANQSGVRYCNGQLFEEEEYSDAEKQYYVSIGNDVWIGYGARIMQGVTIGDGAIIAAGALVNKDVEPFSIVGGVPAKTIKYRFTKDEIDFLESLRWWDKDEEWLNEHSNLFRDISLLRNNV